MSRPPRWSLAAIASIDVAICGNTCLIACATFASSALITSAISRGLIRSISVVAGFTFSVSSMSKELSMGVSMYLTSGLCSSLWQQLLSLHMGIERVFVPTIHSFGVFNWLIAFCVGKAAREKYRATSGDFKELRLFVACKAC